ncbi:MAG: hypothetical protein ACREOU_09750 [Candidatus Eiseniibacteriota bacterium]
MSQAPFVYGFMVLVATAMTVAVVLGAIAGTITGMRRIDLSVGALTALGLYLLSAVLLGFRLGAASGILPLILTFLAGSLVGRSLERLQHLHWIWRTLTALGSALVVGFLYLLPIRLGAWWLAYPRLSWIGVAVLGYLIFLSLRRRAP